MSSKRRAIPNLPPDTPRSLRPLLQAVREAVQVLDNSRRGSKLDAAVTFRDLDKLGVSDLLRQGNRRNGDSTPPPTDTAPDSNVESPTVPTGVEIVTGFDFALCRWDYPTYEGHAYTEIWRQSVDPLDTNKAIDFGSSVLVASVDGAVHSDAIPETTEHYYWVRHVNSSGEHGPVHDVEGTKADTAVRYDQLISDAMKSVLAGLEIWQSDYANALSILDNEVLNLVLETGGTIKTLDRRVSSVESNAAAHYSQTVKTVANKVGSATTQVERLQASFYSTDGNGNLLLDENGEPILASSFIDKVDSVLASANGELLAAIGETLSIDDGEGGSYSLSQIMSVAKDTEGKFSSQWGIKQEVGDLQYGVGFVSYTDTDGKTRTTFHVAAETFSVFDPANGTEISPFVVKDNRVFIKDALIDIASITTLIAGTIVTGELFAGEKIISPIIEGGSIKGSSVNVNNKFTVNSAGVMRAHGAYIYDNSGNVILSSLGVDGTRIKDLTVDTLKIKNNAVTVKSYSETAPVDVPKRGTNFMWSASHYHDGEVVKGNLLVDVVIEAIRTTGGSPADQITFTVEVFESNYYQTVLASKSVTVGQPENGGISFFTPITIFIPELAEESIRVKVTGVSAGEAHTISMSTVVQSAKR